MSMGEFEIIRRYFSRDPADPGVIVGVGDDGAVLAPGPGRELVAVVDTLVDGVHYPRGMDASDVGWRAVAVNLSDIAAMAAVPRWMTLALTLREADPEWLDGFARGLYAAAEAHGLALVGGDTTRGDQTVISVTVLGELEAGRALTRAGANVGDDVYVSGTTGEAAAGLRLLQGGADPSPAGERLAQRFRRPEPRLLLGGRLSGVASAAIDVSDGLHDDLGKLLEASGRGAVVDIDRLPISADLAGLFADDAPVLALAGGDDYELCFTAPPDTADAVAEAGRAGGVAVTCIGRVTARAGIECRRAGRKVNLDLAGFDHFGASANGLR